MKNRQNGKDGLVPVSYIAPCETDTQAQDEVSNKYIQGLYVIIGYFRSIAINR